MKALVDILTDRVERLSSSLEDLNEEHKHTIQVLNDHRRELEKENVLLKREIEDLKKWKDEQKKERDEKTRRIWAFGPNISAAIITVVLTLACNFLLVRAFLP